MDPLTEASQNTEQPVTVAELLPAAPLNVPDTFPVSPYAIPSSGATAEMLQAGAEQIKGISAPIKQHPSPKTPPSKNPTFAPKPKSTHGAKNLQAGAEQSKGISAPIQQHPSPKKSPAKNPTCVPTPKSTHGDSNVSVIRTKTPAHSAASSARSLSKEVVHPADEFKQEEAKILAIIDTQQSVMAVYAEISAYSAGSNACISLRELSAWLPIKLSTLRNTRAINLAFKNAKRLQYLQESKVAAKELLLIKLRPPVHGDRKLFLELEELPSFLENLIAYHRIAKLVERLDPSPDLQLSKLEIYLFLKAIGLSFDCEIGKGVIQKVEASGRISFPELCKISFDLGFTNLEIRDKYNALSKVWNFDIEKPVPKEPLVKAIKTHEEVRSRMRRKIRNQTRSQDVMASTVLPYMIKSQLRQKKQMLRDLSPQAESSSSSIASGVSGVGRIGTSSGSSTRPNSAGIGASLWKHGNTPRETPVPICSAALMTPTSLFSRTQRSFEQGSILDSRRQSPLFVDTENGETVYDIPSLSYSERLKHCPIAKEVFKRIVDRPGLNPFAFSTSRTPRLYGLHTSKPGITRREFICVPPSDSFFHNCDINLRKSYRPCTAGSLQSSAKTDADVENKLKPSWCSGGVPWNGKSTELPKYRGDIGFFEPNQFKKRFDTDMGNRHLWAAPDIA